MGIPKGKAQLLIVLPPGAPARTLEIPGWLISGKWRDRAAGAAGLVTSHWISKGFAFLTAKGPTEPPLTPHEPVTQSGSPALSMIRRCQLGQRSSSSRGIPVD